MMKYLFFCFLVTPCLVQAGVSGLFGANSATFIIQGPDNDAQMLFDSMNVTPTMIKEKLLEKVITRNSIDGEIFRLACRHSLLTNVDSCSLKVTSSQETLINKKDRWVLMGINDRFDAPSFAKKFNNYSTTPYQGEVFLSLDEKLKVWKTYDSSGTVVSFTLSYQESL